MLNKKPDDAMNASRLAAALLFLPMISAAVAVFDVAYSLIFDGLLVALILFCPADWQRVAEKAPFYVQVSVFLCLYLVGTWIGYAVGMGAQVLLTVLGMM